jgi:transposase-like protein
MDNLTQLLDEIKYLNSEDALQVVLQTMMNKGMKIERDIVVSKSDTNKANGYYDRKVNWGSKKLDIVVPRDRESEFRSFLLPDYYKRSYSQSYEEILNSLLVNGYSKSQLMNTLKSLNLPYSEEEVGKLVDEISNESKLFRERELQSDYLVMFIDGYVCEIKTDKGISRHVIFVVIGIDKEAKKDLLGYYAISGSENRDTWKEVFNDLRNRGLRRVSLVVSDDLVGLKEIIPSFFPGSNHQLCIVHLQRNLKSNLSKDLYKKISDCIHEIKISKPTKEVGISKFSDVLNELPKSYDKYKSYLLDRKDNYFAFLDYPKNAQKLVCTTNVVENFNSVIEKIRVKSGGYFQSENLIYVNLYLLGRRLKSSKWKGPIPQFKECLYEFLQTFNIQFLD